MRNLFLCSLVLAVSLSSHSFGATKLLCEVATSGGFTLPQFRQPHGIQVKEDGTLVKFDKNTGSETEVEKLGDKEFKALKNHAKAITSTKLEVVTLGGCMDAPVTFYRCRTSSGRLNVVAQKAMCGIMRSADPDATFVHHKLEELVVRAATDSGERSISSVQPATPAEE